MILSSNEKDCLILIVSQCINYISNVYAENEEFHAVEYYKLRNSINSYSNSLPMPIFHLFDNFVDYYIYPLAMNHSEAYPVSASLGYFDEDGYSSITSKEFVNAEMNDVKLTAIKKICELLTDTLAI